MNRMKIAYVLGRFPVLSETFIGEEIRALQRLGHGTLLMALHRPENEFQPQDKPLADGTFYFSEINAQATKQLLKRYALKKYRAHSFIKTQTREPHIPLLVHAAQLADLIREKGCTHIHAHFAWGAATYAIAAAKLLKLPVTFTCHGSDVYTNPQDLALKCRAADAVIAVAPTLAADLRKLSKTPCHTIYCGVDTTRFNPRAETATDNGRWLCVGRLLDWKGIEDILVAWNLLPQDTRPMLDIVGDGHDREILQNYVTQHGLQKQVTFLGVRNSAWLAEDGPHYRAFISASKLGKDGSRDTAPLVLKEAMAMGLPIVTTRFIDLPIVTGEDCALLCPPGDAKALAAAIMQLHNLPESKRQVMGKAGRKRVEELFSLTGQAEQLVALWSTL